MKRSTALILAFLALALTACGGETGTVETTLGDGTTTVEESTTAPDLMDDLPTGDYGDYEFRF